MRTKASPGKTLPIQIRKKNVNNNVLVWGCGMTRTAIGTGNVAAATFLTEFARRHPKLSMITCVKAYGSCPPRIE